MIIKKTELKSYVVRKLGGGKMCVELNQDHIDDAIDDGFRWFSARRGVYRRQSFTVVEAVQEYDLSTILSSTEIDLVIDIVNLWMPETGTMGYNVFSDWDFLNLSSYPLESVMSSSEMTYGGIVQMLQQKEMIKEILSADTDFEYDEISNTLNIMPRPSSGGTAIFEYKRILANGDKIKPREEEILRRVVVAHAKETLGRIRSKYPSIPVPGGSVSMDGETLLSEYRTDMEWAEEKINNMEPLGFISG
jgi:hypothetical protein